MNEQVHPLLTAYLLGELSPAEQQDVERRLLGSPALRQELEELRLVLGLLDQQPEIIPSAQSREQFYQFLALEERRQPSTSASRPRWSLWAAAAVALLTIGLGFGLIWQHGSRQQEQITRLSEEVVETRKLLLLAMLEDPSASERIRAMNASIRDFQADERVAAALIKRLQEDDSENVRLKAAEALGEFMDLEGVPQAAIQALELENSPEVQITLIEALVYGRRQEAVPSFRRLLERQDVPKVVRDIAAYGLERMS